MNFLGSLILFAVLSSIELACCSTIKESLQPLESLQVESRGDGSSWINGTYCAHSHGGEEEILYKDFIEDPVKDLETAKKVCAAGCDANEACKYAEIIWFVEAEAKECHFLTKDACDVKDDLSFFYLYTKQ